MPLWLRGNSTLGRSVLVVISEELSGVYSRTVPSINKVSLKGAESRHSQSVALRVELVHPVDPATRVRRRREGRLGQRVLLEAAVGDVGQRKLNCKADQSCDIPHKFSQEVRHYVGHMDMHSEW